MDENSECLKSSIRALAEQERSRRPKPPASEELLDYHLGTLPPERAEALRDHLALSAEATAAVLDMASFPNVESRKEGFHLSDDDVAAEWRRMEQLIAETAPDEVPRPPAPRLRRRIFASRTYSYAMAAALLFAVVALSVWVAALHQTVDRLSAPHFDVYLADLVPLAQQTSERGAETESGREPEAVVRVPAWSDRMILVLNLAEPPAATEYLVEIADVRDVEIWSTGGLGSRSDGGFILELPRDFLSEGRYQVRLLGRIGDQTSLLARYTFEIDYE